MTSFVPPADSASPARNAVTNRYAEHGRSLSLSTDVQAYVSASLSENTKRAYASDLVHFEAWGGTLPATDIVIAEYLAAYAGELSVSTLTRRMVAISKAHDARGQTNPVKSELVRATLRGIRRTHGTALRRARPLIKEELFDVLAQLGTSTKDVRDRAVLLMGFACGFRRSELVAVNFNDIDRVRQGVIIHIRRSKTDQTGQGRQVGIPFGRTRYCPVTALDDWLAESTIGEGSVFRSVDRHGNILDNRLGGDAVSIMIKERVSNIGLEPGDYSGHSLRAGFVTSAAQAGVSSWKIRQQTGHASDAMMSHYIRDGELFVDNAVGALL